MQLCILWPRWVKHRAFELSAYASGESELESGFSVAPCGDTLLNLCSCIPSRLHLNLRKHGRVSSCVAATYGPVRLESFAHPKCQQGILQTFWMTSTDHPRKTTFALKPLKHKDETNKSR
eukprot:1860863-Amphidinium_carterae.1